MSNVIKAYSVRYEDDAKKTIDTHIKVEQDILSRRNLRVTQQETSDEFVEGLNAIVVDPIPEESNHKEQVDKIYEQAKLEAEKILENARLEAEKIKQEAYQAAEKKGYEEGKKQSTLETQKMQADFENKTQKLQREYEQLILEIEPQMVNIMADLIGKITGILVEDQKDVIYYLVEKALRNADRSNEYTIRTSVEDYEVLLTKKDDLLEMFPNGIQLNIIKDLSFVKNQCVIETELRMINCSLDVQLENLIKDLKLLGRV